MGFNSGKPGFDADAIRELSKLLTETGLTEIEIETKGARVRVSRQTGGSVSVASAPAAHAPAAASAPVAAKGPAAGAVPSPMVGTVYTAPEPGKPAFVKVGDSVKEGDTLFIVEAMKTMNPILAPRAGKITEINVENGQPVEFGQTMLVLA